MGMGIENSVYNSRYNTQIRPKSKRETLKNKEKENVQDNKKNEELIAVDERFEEFQENFEGEELLPDGYRVINSILSLNSGAKSSVIIDPKILRRMNEPEIAKKLKNISEELPKTEKMIQAWYKNSNIEVISHGWIIDKDGNLSSWSITRTKQKKKDYMYLTKERLEKIRKEKKEKERLEKKRLEKKKEEKRIEKKREEKRLEKKRLEKKEKEKNKVKKSQINNAKMYNDSKLKAINMRIINITR